MNAPSLGTLLRRKLLLLVLTPSLAMILVLGSFLALRQYSNIKDRNQLLVQALSRYVSVYVEDALSALRHAALSGKWRGGQDGDVRLINLYSAYPHFERLLLLDKDMNILESYPSGLVGLDFPHLINPEVNGSISRPFFSPETDSFIVLLSFPTDRDRYIIAELNLDVLRRHLQEFTALESNTNLILTDSFGNVVLHPDEAMVRQQANIGDWEIFQKPGAEGTAFELFKREGQSLLGSVVTMPSLRWRMILFTSLWSIFTPVAQTILALILFLTVFFALVVVGFRYELHRRAVAPLANFAAALQLAARGDYTRAKSLEGETFAELQVMEREFAAMSHTILGRENELRRSRAYIKSIMDSLSSALVSVDRDARLILMNAMASRLCGVELSVAKGMDVYALFPMLEQVRKNLSATLALRKAVVVERQTAKMGERTTYFDIAIYPLVYEEEGGAVIRIEDVTTRAQLEEIMVQTEKMMSVGGLAAGMAHEINNPLGGILQSAQNIRRRIDPGIPANLEAASALGTDLRTVRAYLEARGILKMLAGIAESGQRAASIVSNMLNFSRRSTSQLASCDLHALIENVLALASNDYDLKKRYDFRKVAIVRNYAENLPQVPCTATEIEQVILNLLKNAAQAMSTMEEPPSEPTLIISTHAGARHAEIRIHDNGPGIPREDRKRIFEPFFTTKDPGEGTGLGLSVSYFIIVNNHKGTFAVKSEPGAGSEFIIRLPLEVEKVEKGGLGDVGGG